MNKKSMNSRALGKTGEHLKLGVGRALSNLPSPHPHVLPYTQSWSLLAIPLAYALGVPEPTGALSRDYG